ncbi:MAG: hypothetical protein MHM6MM_007019 [Cercozoa sp. M6MM]
MAPRKSTGGAKKKGKKAQRKPRAPEGGVKDLLLKGDGQEYAQVMKMLGNGRLEAFCFDGKTRQCKIRGTMMHKRRVNVGDVILVGLREFQDSKADVMHLYTDAEARMLRKQKEIPDNAELEDIDNIGSAAGMGFSFDVDADV